MRTQGLAGGVIAGFLAGAIVCALLTPAPAAATSPSAGQRPDAAGSPEASGGEPAAVRGKVLYQGNPVAGARVFAYADARDGFRGEARAASAPTAEDGSFSVGLEPGAYFLVARGPLPSSPPAAFAGEPLFGYYGGNPVTLGPAAQVVANLQVVRRIAPIVTGGGDPALARVEGVVLGPAGPVAGAAVHVYADASRQFRGPDLFGPQGAVAGGTDERGTFSVELPPGSYHLVASKRRGGDTLGPLRPGDLHGYYDGNPVDLAAGTTTATALHVVEKLREGVAPNSASQGGSGIRGRVVDPSGNVPQGVYAFATTDPGFMIGAMPPHRSQPLGPDGSFSIDLPAGDTYYVSARSGYGGPPLPGEWHGFYGEQAPRPIAVGAGKIVEGIDFVVRRME